MPCNKFVDVFILMHADDVLLEVVPPWPNLFLVFATWRSALEAGGD